MGAMDDFSLCRTGVQREREYRVHTDYIPRTYIQGVPCTYSHTRPCLHPCLILTSGKCPNFHFSHTHVQTRWNRVHPQVLSISVFFFRIYSFPLPSYSSQESFSLSIPDVRRDEMSATRLGRSSFSRQRMRFLILIIGVIKLSISCPLSRRE